MNISLGKRLVNKFLRMYSESGCTLYTWVHMNAHQRSFATKQISPILWMSASLFLEPPQPLANEFMNKVTMGPGVAVRHVLNNMNFTKTDLDYHHCWGSKLTAEQLIWDNTVPNFRGMSLPLGGRSITLGRKRAASCFLWKKWAYFG